MNKQALKATEIETFALSTSAALDELRRPVSHDGGDYPSEPETRRRSALRWFIDTLALAGAGMAGVYVGVWLDPPNSNPNRVDTEETE
jgi:hypothetical protein